VSGQATLSGRHTLQIWEVTAGDWQGVNLAGLRLAVLAAGRENLAAENAHADQAVVYLPDQASHAQQQALVDWVKTRNPQLATAHLQTRVVPISLTSSTNGAAFRAGSFVVLKTVALGDCANRVCGESLWYQPSTPTSVFTVALNESSTIQEPLMKLTWEDFGKRSVFVARFGVTETANSHFVQASDWCGASGVLF
jgi:hypothetical protein